jgi:hypothetical protein
MSNAEIQKLLLQGFPLVIAFLSAAIACISVIVAVKTYRKSVRTKEAEFISQLHLDFFVEKTYKKIRDILDDDQEAASTIIDRLVKAESADFTDFLNFFELAAYFESCDTLSTEAVEAILGYYMNLFEENQSLREYIRNPRKSFEYLDSYLGKRRSRQKD